MQVRTKHTSNAGCLETGRLPATAPNWARAGATDRRHPTWNPIVVGWQACSLRNEQTTMDEDRTKRLPVTRFVRTIQNSFLFYHLPYHFPPSCLCFRFLARLFSDSLSFISISFSPSLWALLFSLHHFPFHFLFCRCLCVTASLYFPYFTSHFRSF